MNDDDDVTDTNFQLFIICFQKLPEAPTPPFVAETKMTRSSAWITKYGPVNKNVCAGITFTSHESAAKELTAYAKILKDKRNIYCMV